MLNLPLLVHDESGTVCELGLIVKDAVCLRDLALHVTEKRKLDTNFLGESGVGGSSVNADSQNCGVVEVDLAFVDTSLVSLKFLGSTTGKGKDVERQNDVLFTPKIAQLYGGSQMAAQREVWSRVANFQERVRDLGLLLSRNDGKHGQRYHEYGQHHWDDVFHLHILSTASEILVRAMCAQPLYAILTHRCGWL